MRIKLYRFKHSDVYTDTLENLIEMNKLSDFPDAIVEGTYEFKIDEIGRPDKAYNANYTSFSAINTLVPNVDDGILVNVKDANWVYFGSGFPEWYNGDKDSLVFLLRNVNIIEEEQIIG